MLAEAFPEFVISIHAPRAGSDNTVFRFLPVAANFNPRSPCGERRLKPWTTSPHKIFQSTLPVRGATRDHAALLDVSIISIHAPRAGSDDVANEFSMFSYISIHAPRAGSDIQLDEVHPLIFISIHAPRAGSDCTSCLSSNRHIISIHAPRAGSDEMETTITDKAI